MNLFLEIPEQVAQIAGISIIPQVDFVMPDERRGDTVKGYFSQSFTPIYNALDCKQIQINCEVGLVVAHNRLLQGLQTIILELLNFQKWEITEIAEIIDKDKGSGYLVKIQKRVNL